MQDGVTGLFEVQCIIMHPRRLVSTKTWSGLKLLVWSLNWSGLYARHFGLYSRQMTPLVFTFWGHMGKPR